jgi:hypothetical protein
MAGATRIAGPVPGVADLRDRLHRDPGPREVRRADHGLRPALRRRLRAALAGNPVPADVQAVGRHRREEPEVVSPDLPGRPVRRVGAHRLHLDLAGRRAAPAPTHEEAVGLLGLPRPRVSLDRVGRAHELAGPPVLRRHEELLPLVAPWHAPEVPVEREPVRRGPQRGEDADGGPCPARGGHHRPGDRPAAGPHLRALVGEQDTARGGSGIPEEDRGRGQERAGAQGVARRGLGHRRRRHARRRVATPAPRPLRVRSLAPLRHAIELANRPRVRLGQLQTVLRRLVGGVGRHGGPETARSIREAPLSGSASGTGGTRRHPTSVFGSPTTRSRRGSSSGRRPWGSVPG